MQDLGRIIIDINENGGGGKAEGVSGVGDMAKTAESAASEAAAGTEFEALEAAVSATGAAFVAIGAAIEIGVAAIKGMAKAIAFMHNQIMDFAASIKDFSPAVAVADMENEIKMMATKFRMGAAVGGAVGGYIQEVGGLERSLTELKGYASGLLSIILKPMLKAINAGLDFLKQYLPAILEGIAKIMEVIAMVFNQIGGYLVGQGGLFAAAGVVFNVIAANVYQMSRDVRAIKTNTSPDPDFSQINQGFLNDLRLMGAKIP
jgi:hypothetical protein